MYSVYKHTSPSGKVYIGVTKQKPQMRWQNGLGYRTQEYFYRAIQKYGWDNFVHEIVYQTENYTDANRMEIELIARYKSSDKNYGYNIEGGGNLKKTVSESTRQKLRERNTSPEHLKLIAQINAKRWSDPDEHKRMSERMSGSNNPMYGTKLTEEHGRKLKEGFAKVVFAGKKGADNPMYGKHHSEEVKKRLSKGKMGANNPRARQVVCVETQVIYDSVRDAYRATGIRWDSISRVCLGKGETAGGFHWEYVKEV
jgi:group I intron endonuclease